MLQVVKCICTIFFYVLQYFTYMYVYILLERLIYTKFRRGLPQKSWIL